MLPPRTKPSRRRRFLISSGPLGSEQVLGKTNFVLLGLAVAGLVVFLVWLVRASVSHFDVSDEGLYLLAAANGFGHQRFGSGFGVITGILYDLVGGDLPGFRLLGFFIMTAANAGLAWGTTLSLPGLRSRRGTILVFLLVTFLPSVTYYTHFPLLTPSYNWSSQVGLTIFSASVLLLTQSRLLLRIGGVIPVALAGVGLSILLWSKPTAVLVYPLLVVSIMALSRPSREIILRFIAIGPSTLIVSVLFSYLVSNPISEINRALFAYKALRVTNPNYGIIQTLDLWWNTSIGPLSAAAFLLTIIGPIVAVSYILSARERFQMLRLADYTWLASVLLTIIFLSITALGDDSQVRLLPLMYFLTFFWVISRGTMSFFLLRKQGRTFNPEAIALGAIIVVIPQVHGFGSGNGVSQMSLSIGVSIALALAVVVSSNRASWRQLEVAAAMTGVLVACLVLVAAQNPYRSSPLGDNKSLLRVGNGVVYVDPEMAENLEQLKSCSQNYGLSSESLILDFTYWSPGVVYFLNGRAPATLIVASEDGSDFSKFALEIESRESGLSGLRAAWILLPTLDDDPSAARAKIAAEALTSVGLSLSSYSPVCSTPQWRLYHPNT